MFKTSVMNAVQSVKAHSGVRRWRTRVLIQSGQTLLSRPHFRQAAAAMEAAGAYRGSRHAGSAWQMSGLPGHTVSAGMLRLSS